MDSDADFNRKSFTTGHTGFGVPFLVNPDRVDVPRNAARPLRYLDRYVTVTQGEVFYMTEALAQLEGLERGPAGNTSLAAAVRAGAGARPRRRRRRPGDRVHGCGQAPDRAAHVRARARRRGAARRSGRERARPGDRHPRVAGAARVEDVDLDGIRRSFLRRALAERRPSADELGFWRPRSTPGRSRSSGGSRSSTSLGRPRLAPDREGTS